MATPAKRLKPASNEPTKLIEAEIVPTKALDLFDKKKIGLSVLGTKNFTLLPSLPYQEGTPIVFEIPANNELFLDNHFYLDTVIQVQKKVKKTIAATQAGGAATVTYEWEAVTANDDFTLNNLPFHSLFDSIVISANDVIISSRDGCYPYNAWLHRCHLSTKDEHEIHKVLELSEFDEASKTDQLGKDMGKIAKARKDMALSDQEIFMRGRLVSPFLNQNKVILPGVNLTITLFPSKQGFRILASNSTAEIRVKITRIKLSGSRLFINPKLFLATMRNLEYEPALYHILRNETTYFQVPSSATFHDHQIGLQTATVPHQIYMAIFDADAMFGKATESAFRSKCSDIEEAQITIEDKKFPSLPFSFTSREGQVIAYSAYKQNTSMLLGGESNAMDFERYSKDFAVLSFNLDRYAGAERNNDTAMTLSRNGAVSLHLKFTSPLNRALTVVLFCIYNNTIKFGASLLPSTNYL